MKKVLVAAAALVISVAMNAQSAFDSVAKVNTEKHDFGKILQGKPVDFYFEITNKSDKPIVIEYAQPSCGCTTPEVPKEPIAPGSTSKIKVSYNAAGMGAFNKTVTIKLAGVDQPKVVTISGEQLNQADYDKYVKENPVQPVKSNEQPVKTTKSKTNKSKTKTGS